MPSVSNPSWFPVDCWKFFHFSILWLPSGFSVMEMAASNPGPGGTKDIYRNATAGMLLKRWGWNVGVKCEGLGNADRGSTGRRGRSLFVINLPAERGWVSKYLSQGPRLKGVARGPRTEEQFLTEPPKLCWLLDSFPTQDSWYPALLPIPLNVVSCPKSKDTSHPNKCSACAY